MLVSIQALITTLTVVVYMTPATFAVMVHTVPVVTSLGRVGAKTSFGYASVL